jgi:hypothetical protein
MSPQAPHPAHGRYQSQFFNFINRHSQRLRDQSHQWLRQLKVASIWGGQLALYPIYALFQAGRLAGHQLRSQSPTASALTIADRPPLAAPARLFYQLMHWVQQGPIAHQVNWFDEAKLVATPQSDWFQPHFGQLPSDALIRLNGVTNFDWQTWAHDLPQTSPLHHWLKAAISYFFGRTTATIPAAPSPKMVDPWDITLDATPIAGVGDNHPIAETIREFQLPGHEAPPVIQAAPDRPALPTTAQSRSSKSTIGQLIRQTIGKVMPTQAAAKAAAITPSLSASREPNFTWANVFAHDLTTTLIDTVATPIGYVQHPLERLLGWLDQAILWLETQASKLWQWFRTDRAKAPRNNQRSD